MYDSVLPSSLLQFAEEDYFSSLSHSMHNTALRIGIVKQVVYPGDDKNLEKSAPEYDVLVFQQDKDKGVIPITYRNCVTMDMFGGIGDFFEFVKSEPTDKQSTKLDIDDGSYVLMLCIDGTSGRGVILGALPHHNRKSTLPKAKAKHLEGEYNGLRIQINDNGELTLTFKGKTDTKGVPTTPAKGGSQIRMEVDGSVEINDRDLDGALLAGNDKKAAENTAKAAEDYDKIRIDKTAKSITVKSRGDYNQTTGGNSTNTITGNSTQSMKDLLMDCTGKAAISSGSTFDIKATGAFGLKAASAKFDFDDALEVKASLCKFGAQSIMLGEGGSPAVTLATQHIGIGNLGIPVISTAIGPFSSVVTIA